MAQKVKNLPANQETCVWSLGHEYSLEKDMTSHSSVLAWRILWRGAWRTTSTGSQRVTHQWVTKQSTEVQISVYLSWEVLISQKLSCTSVFEYLWMPWKCCTQYASKFGKLSRCHRTGKGQFSFQSLRKAMPKNAQTTAQLHSSHMLLK